MTAILGAFPNKSARICDRWGQSPFIILKYGSPSHKFWRAVSKPWAGRGPLSYVLRILIKFLARVLEAQGPLCENPVFCFPDRRLVSCKETGRANSSGKRNQVFGPGSRSSRLFVREPTVLPSGSACCFLRTDWTSESLRKTYARAKIEICVSIFFSLPVPFRR